MTTSGSAICLADYYGIQTIFRTWYAHFLG